MDSRLEMHLDYKKTFNSPEGRRVLEDIAKECLAFGNWEGVSPEVYQAKNHLWHFIRARLGATVPKNVPAQIAQIVNLEPLKEQDFKE